MPYHRSVEPRDPLATPRCLHYRSKAMCVTGELVPRDPDEQHNHDQNCWCNMTSMCWGLTANWFNSISAWKVAIASVQCKNCGAAYTTARPPSFAG